MWEISPSNHYTHDTDTPPPALVAVILGVSKQSGNVLIYISWLAKALEYFSCTYCFHH